MKVLENGLYTGERALYHQKDLKIIKGTFFDGESPLKECNNIHIFNSIFKWKYPLWYSSDIIVHNSTLLDTARSGIWYTSNIKITDSIIEAPKTFRRSNNITLTNVNLPNALETFWNCKNIKLSNVNIKGDYLCLNSENIVIDNMILDGNYAFDGCKNIEINNSKLLSKDSFWNCENVIVRNSLIIGEYLGWNSNNVTFINCTIDSMQGMCYMKDIKMENCTLLNTNLCFELCTVDAKINSSIDSVKNPISGRIIAKKIDQIILDEEMIDPSKTIIKTEE